MILLNTTDAEQQLNPQYVFIAENKKVHCPVQQTLLQRWSEAVWCVAWRIYLGLSVKYRGCYCNYLWSTYGYWGKKVAEIQQKIEILIGLNPCWLQAIRASKVTASQRGQKACCCRTQPGLSTQLLPVCGVRNVTQENGSGWGSRCRQEHRTLV